MIFTQIFLFFLLLLNPLWLVPYSALWEISKCEKYKREHSKRRERSKRLVLVRTREVTLNC